MDADLNWNDSLLTLDSLLTAPERRDDLIAVIAWLIPIVYALIANILLLIGILRNTSMRNATSYWFIISLAVCDCGMAVISLGHLLPATAFHTRFLIFDSPRNVIMIFVYDVFWYTAVVQLGIMALNRFSSIVYPMQFNQMFSHRRTAFIILLGNFLGVLVSVPTLFPCCKTLWDANYYITLYVPADTWYKYVDMTVSLVSLVLMIFSYSIIIYKVHKSGVSISTYNNAAQKMQAKGSQQSMPQNHFSRRNIRLFLQFLIISLMFLVTWTTWQWLPYTSSSKWVYFAMTMSYFANNAAHPTVSLIFNTQLRRELQLLFRKRIGKNESSTTKEIIVLPAISR